MSGQDSPKKFASVSSRPPTPYVRTPNNVPFQLGMPDASAPASNTAGPSVYNHTSQGPTFIFQHPGNYQLQYQTGFSGQRGPMNRVYNAQQRAGAGRQRMEAIMETSPLPVAINRGGPSFKLNKTFH